MHSHRPNRHHPTAAAMAVCVLLLSACGGGGGTGTSAAPTAAVVATTTVSGVVAIGAALAGASVRISDRVGAEVCAVVTDDDGRYRCTLQAGVRGPLAVLAQRDDRVLVSAAASAAGGIVNVTPLTTLIAARLVPGGDPAALGAAIVADPAVASAERIAQRVEEVQALLAPLLAAAGDTLDPINGRFDADGTGHDRVLELLQVSIRPAANSSNIEVTVKTRPSRDEAAPISLQFRSSDVAPAPLADAVSAADLPSDNLLGLMTGFVVRATACHAEPLQQRVAGAAPGATRVDGSAEHVKAAACRSLFVDDDPSAYLDSGLRVGSDGAFPGLFNDAATGARFDRASFEYRWANGDYHISLRTTTLAGVSSERFLTLRQQGGQLKAVGNQYRYQAHVRPVVVNREFPLQPGFNWLGTGYGAQIRNTTDPRTGAPLFEAATLISPDGLRTLYKPLPGLPDMGIVSENGRQTSHGHLQLAAAFQDPASAGRPADLDANGGAIFVQPALSDDALQALHDQSVWTIEWQHADPATPNVVQSYRMLTRAPTLGEVRRMRFAELSDAFRAEMLARPDVQAVNGFFVYATPSAEQPNVFSLATAAGGSGWGVPEQALAPRDITVYGVTARGEPFSNTAGVGADDRHGSVACVAQSARDLHCDTGTGVSQFTPGSLINFFSLSLSTPRGLGIEKQVGLYRLAD